MENLKSKYFEENEFRCKCGCGLDVQDFVKKKVYIAREYSGVPYILSSGARCPKHNQDVGGSDTSSHPDGFAVDIRFRSFLHMLKILFGLIKVGWKRIGVNWKKKFIHADFDPRKLPAIWDYKK